MPKVRAHQLASVDCFMQYAIQRRYRDPRSEDMRTTHNLGGLKSLTLTRLELNELALGNRSDEDGEGHLSSTIARFPRTCFPLDSLHERKSGDRKTVPQRLA